MDHAQLTRKQKEFFDFILEYKNDHDVWPTYREIADTFGYKSPNSVTQNIQALLKKEYLIKTEDDEYDIHPDYSHKIEEKKPRGIPVRGLIAAGYLQEAVEADLGQITLETLFPDLNNVFALRVSGMSMKEAGIHDGDFVLLKDSDIKEGEIGAVLYNDETSLKRIHYNKNGLRLEPANEEFEDIVIEPDEYENVQVIGKYVGHVSRSGIFRA